MGEFEIHIEKRDGKNEIIKFTGSTKEALQILQETLWKEDTKSATLRKVRKDVR